MKKYMPFSPIEITFATRQEAVEYLNGLRFGNGKTLLLASDRRITALGLEQWLLEAKKTRDQIHIGKVPANPSVSDVYETLLQLRGTRLQQIIAIGGGSCIDLAKAISALLNIIPVERLSRQSVRDAIISKEYQQKHAFIDIIALPTTSGTGSEVTKWATIWDMEKKEKLSIDTPDIFPKAAVLVPEFTTTMSKRLTLSSGLDALSHAMEAFWARSRSPLSQSLAITAINYVSEFLPKALEKGNDIEMRKGMCIASLLAGLAFSITRTTACHSISYPLTIYHGMEHGLAVASTIAQIAERNASEVPEIERIYSVFGNKEGFSRWLKDVSQPVMDFRLSAFGVRETDLELIVEKTYTQGRMDNNPILFTPAEVKDILLKAL